ncbi:hypothetical protein J437_LFUL019628 [Ladona fulva]|uniref:Uncharacterized protein n=1 Tax=Ladona fulva TaxID=123851 RepID=A0A8K0KR69_LADFU|nr:hypothetical protein J437_LFUL019628 [Ladona fulva]
MSLKFAELKESWEYSYPISSSIYDKGTNSHGRKARLKSGYGGYISDELQRMGFGDEKRGGCDDQGEGLFWQPLPHKLKPASLCNLGIHNSSCNLEDDNKNGK